MAILEGGGVIKRIVRMVVFTPMLVAIAIALWAFDEPRDLARSLRDLWDGAV